MWGYFSWSQIQGIPSGPHANPKREKVLLKQWLLKEKSSSIHKRKRWKTHKQTWKRSSKNYIYTRVGRTMVHWTFFMALSPLLWFLYLSALRNSSQQRSHHSFLEVSCDSDITWKITRHGRSCLQKGFAESKIKNWIWAQQRSSGIDLHQVFFFVDLVWCFV